MSTTRKVFLKSAGVALGILLLLSLAVDVQAATLYVTPLGNGNGDGSSWANAMDNVAFPSALQTCATYTDFWVKTGTYKPTTNPNLREATFPIRPNVYIYGGFAGTETALNQRNPALYVTILSGEINYDGSLAGNSYHVVTGASGANSALLDGFTVTGGNDDKLNGHGGGMNNSNCTYLSVNNCTFSGNYGRSGGGMYNYTSNTTVTYCTFSGNESYYEGGGMFSDQCGSLTVTGCTFSGNRANQGGGMFNINSNSIITNCTFSGNSAHNDNNLGANWGGGLSNVSGTHTATNCTFWGNSAVQGGNANFNNAAAMTLTSCLLWDPYSNSEILNGWGGTADFSYCLVRAWTGGTGNINPADPVLGPLADNGGPTKTHALLPGSPAIDAGNPASTLTIDQRGVARPQASGYDMGAFELATFTISGNAGVAGAVLSYTDGTAKTASADGSGNYSFFVSTNWSGTVTPALAGYGFYPTSRSYTNVLASKTGQDYSAFAIIPTIWGTIKSGGNPLSGVVLNGLPGNPTTNASGQYTTTVTYGWSGTVTPALTGYTFSPATQVYASVVTDTATDYTATPVNYTITATAGTGGAITPSGVVNVAYGKSQDFAINPDLHYRIGDVLVDGTSVGAVSSYSFTNVASNHTIAASFAIIQYTVTASVDGGHGTASPALQSVNSGETALIRLVPETGYKLSYLSDNGSIVNPVSEYRIYNIGSDHLVVARFENSPPLVEITEPEDGALVTGVVEVKARIEDDGKVQRAEFYVDGVRRQAAVAHEDVTEDPGTAAKAAVEPATWQLSTTEMCLEFGPGPLLINSDNILWRLDESGALLPALVPVRKVTHVQRLLQTDALLFVFAEPCPDSAGARSRVHLLNRASGTLLALVPESFATPLLLANNPVLQEDEQGGIWFVKSIQNGLQTELWRWNGQNGPELIGTVPFVPMSWQLLSAAEVMFQEGTLNGARRWLLRGNELRAVDDHAALLVGNRQVAGSDAAAAELLENGFSARFGSRSFALSGNSVRVRDIQLGTIMEVSAGSWEPYRVSVAGGDSFLILGRDPRRKMTGLLRLGWDEAGARIEELAEFAADPACAAELEAGAGSAAAGSPRMRPIGMADSGEWTFVWDSGLDQAGTHTLKVVATDDAGATGMDEVRVNLAKIKLTLSALRKTVRSWSFVRYYGQIELAMTSENSPSLRFRLMRRTGSGDYAQLQEFGESELQNGAWSFQDKYLEKDRLYTYVVEALDPSGRVLGRSDELTI